MLIVLPTIMFATAIYIDTSSKGSSITVPIILVISLSLFETALVLIFIQKTMKIYQDRIEFTYSLLRSEEVLYFKDVKKIDVMKSRWLGWYGRGNWRVHFTSRDYAHRPMYGAFSSKEMEAATNILYKLGLDNGFNIHPFMLTISSSGRS
jgi:hypothetical protein